MESGDCLLKFNQFYLRVFLKFEHNVLNTVGDFFFDSFFCFEVKHIRLSQKKEILPSSHF